MSPATIIAASAIGLLCVGHIGTEVLAGSDKPVAKTSIMADDCRGHNCGIPEVVRYTGPHAPGTMVVDGRGRPVLYVLTTTKAVRYSAAIAS